MVLPAITGKECTSKLSVRQFSDFEFPAINDAPEKLNRVWSTVCSRFLKTESKIKQCAPFLKKNEEKVTQQNEKQRKGSSETNFNLPVIFHAKNILNEERSLTEMIASKPNDVIEQSQCNKGKRSVRSY